MSKQSLVVHGESQCSTALTGFSSVFFVLVIAGLLIGCSTVSKTPTPQLNTTENREAKFKKVYEYYKSKGYSDTRAKAAAERDVPFGETTYSESYKENKKDAAKKKFAEDLEKLNKSR